MNNGTVLANLTGPFLIFVFLVQDCLVSYEEVAVQFSEEEWFQLDPNQKALHSEVMLENHRNVASLGKDCYCPEWEDIL